MSRRFVTKQLWLVALAAGISLLSAGCDAPADASSAKKSGISAAKLRVVATTGMVGDLARAVGGPHVSVSVLMGPGVDPHLYKPTAGDVSKLSSADLVLYNGLHLEGKMGQIFARLGRRRPVVPVTDGIERSQLLSPPAYPGAFDPHVWFDVALWAGTPGRVANALSERLPTRRAIFEANAAAYRKKLLALDGWIRGALAKIPEGRRVLVTAHDAFAYFGRRYGVEVVGLQGISTASKASLRDIKRVTDVIVARRIPAIFVESSVPRRTVEAVQAACRSRGQKVRIGGELYSDALGPAGSGAESYIGMVRHNVRQIAAALREAESK